MDFELASTPPKELVVSIVLFDIEVNDLLALDCSINWIIIESNTLEASLYFWDCEASKVSSPPKSIGLTETISLINASDIFSVIIDESNSGQASCAINIVEMFSSEIHYLSFLGIHGHKCNVHENSSVSKSHNSKFNGVIVMPTLKEALAPIADLINTTTGPKMVCIDPSDVRGIGFRKSSELIVGFGSWNITNDLDSAFKEAHDQMNNVLSSCEAVILILNGWEVTMDDYGQACDMLESSLDEKSYCIVGVTTYDEKSITLIGRR